MKFVHFLILLTLSTCALADGDWGNNAGDCRQRWWDKQEGCRIRQQQKTEELAGIDIYILAADAARDAAVAPKQSAAERFARLDEQQRDRADVFLPYLRRSIALCREMRELLINTSAKELARVKSLIEFMSLRLPDESQSGSDAAATLSAASAAALTFETSDALALSLILDSSLEDKSAVQNTQLQPSKERAVTLGFIIEKLETAAENIEKVHHQLAGLLGRLTAENELELSTQEKQLDALKIETATAAEARAKTEKIYSDALAKAQALIARKSALPGDIRSEELAKGVGMQRMSDCQNHFSPPLPFSDRHHGGDGRL